MVSKKGLARCSCPGGIENIKKVTFLFERAKRAQLANRQT